MRKAQKTLLVALLLVLGQIWIVSSKLVWDGRPENNQHLSTPEECRRMCQDDEPPRTCYYHFHVEHYMTLSGACDYNETQAECVRQDGIEKSIMTINRQIPGPAIEVCKNDMIIVDVENAAQGTGITIHWHGLFQKGFQYYDGVPLVTQCPIIESNTFRYKFRAANSGTHMYHAHTYLHMMEGLYGTLIVREQTNSEPHKHLYDVDLRSILISDVFHDNANEHYPGRRRRDTGQAAKNFLINGLGYYKDPETNVTTSTRVTSFKVKKGLRYRYRMANVASTVCLSELRVEDHKLMIIALDGEPVKPIIVDVITTATGERVDFVLHANKSVGSYLVTLRGLGECQDNKVFQYATLDYTGSNGNTRPPPTYDDIPKDGVIFNPEVITGCLEGSPDSKCVSQAESVSEDANSVLREPDMRVFIIFGFGFPDDREEFKKGSYAPYLAAPGGVTITSTVNNITYMDPSSPPLSQRLSRSDQPLSNCYSDHCSGVHVIKLSLNALVELVFVDGYNFTGLNHPFHLHGHTFSVLAEGYNKGTNSTVEDVMPQVEKVNAQVKAGLIKNPPKKDTIAVPTNGIVITRFIANNPGWWLCHCHFTFHTITGMDFVFHIGNSHDLPPVPPNFPKCGNFYA